MVRGLHSSKRAGAYRSEGTMPVRLIVIALVLVVAAAGGLMVYGYSVAPTSRPVHVEIPNDQFPQ